LDRGSTPLASTKSTLGSALWEAQMDNTRTRFESKI